VGAGADRSAAVLEILDQIREWIQRGDMCHALAALSHQIDTGAGEEHRDFEPSCDAAIGDRARDDVLSTLLSAMRRSGSLQFCFMPSGDWQTDDKPSMVARRADRDHCLERRICERGGLQSSRLAGFDTLPATWRAKAQTSTRGQDSRATDDRLPKRPEAGERREAFKGRR
jgi:hypothetical protein